MIIRNKIQVFKWLEKYDHEYQDKIKKNTYELIDLHDDMNQALFNEMIKKDNLPFYYFQKLKSEGHQYIVNAKGDVNICNQKLEKIPFQFYHVDGSFYCSHNQLTSLQGCPQIVGESFHCHYNQLNSLQYCPQSVGGSFYCSHNKITSLEYCPQSVGSNFSCCHNQLKSLEYCPQYIVGDFYFYDNQIESLLLFPSHVNGLIDLSNTQDLLKYKKESTDIYIQNMSDHEFLEQRDFSFWQKFHLLEKAKKENSQILDDLFLDDKIEQNHCDLPKIKKV